jgi:hypothetical protein
MKNFQNIEFFPLEINRREPFLFSSGSSKFSNQNDCSDLCRGSLVKSNSQNSKTKVKELLQILKEKVC